MNNLEKVKEYQDKIQKNKEQMSKLQKDNSKLRKEMRNEVFNLVLDYVNIGSEIEFTQKEYVWRGNVRKYDVNRAGIRSGDIVKIVKKNRKSVVIEWVKVNNTRRRGPIGVGKTKRIISETFGDFVYNNSTLSGVIERDVKIKALLEEL